MILAIDLSFFGITMGVILKVISSFIFIFLLLYLFRPNVKISKNICYTKLPPDNKYYFVFKVVNMSLFPTFDVTVKIDEMEPHFVNNGQKINYREVPIPNSTDGKPGVNLPKFRKKEGYGDHAYLIRTNTKIKAILKKPESRLRITVSSKHSLTNLTRVNVYYFKSADCIVKDKNFKFGKSLEPEE